MGEQFKFNFESPKQESYESMSQEALVDAYKNKIGITPRVGRNSREHLIKALQNPTEERDALHAIDKEDEKSDAIYKQPPRSRSKGISNLK